jgi:DNA-binding NarL/FixJ family response regulator
MPTVFIVDDHQFVRDALTDLVADAPDLEVVGVYADGSEVAAAAHRTQPDVVLMDLQMPRMDGLTAARAVLAVQTAARVLILSGHLTPASVGEARSIGVSGYLLKDDDPGTLPTHIRTVAAGGTAWHPLAAALLEDGPDPAATLSWPALPSPTTPAVQRFGQL